ncbi:hypothetical protein [Nocardioides zeae]
MGDGNDVIDLLEWSARREWRAAAPSDGELRCRAVVADLFAEGWDCLATGYVDDGP